MTKLTVRAKEAAWILGISPSTLAKMRMRRDGPLFIKANDRLVLYRLDDIHSWLERNASRPRG